MSLISLLSKRLSRVFSSMDSSKASSAFSLLYGPTITSVHAAAAAAAKSLQSCATLCNPIDSSSPGYPVPGILQERTLEWVAISFSNAWKWKVKGKSLSRVQLLATPWNAAYQAPPSLGFSRQEYWSDYWKNHSFDYTDVCQQSDISAFLKKYKFILIGG